jgi:hypothetical protein
MVSILGQELFSTHSHRQDNQPQELSLTDFSGFQPAPGRLVGKNSTVYWRSCASVTLAKVGEFTGKEIGMKTGEMLLVKGFVLIVVGDGGSYKE